ncbi:MAG: VanZ family protein [Ruminococcus sp.]|nr:VanZ family protein [Ruminococcus sp.]
MQSTSTHFSPLRILCILMTIVCMTAIFMFSTEDAEESTDTSGSVIEAVVSVIMPDYNEMSENEQLQLVEKLQHLARKTAHFTIYLALGFFASGAIGRRRALSRKSCAALGFCFLYACSDELHQHFVPGRSGQFTDVLLDSTGAFFGILISLGLLYLTRKKTAPQS